MYPQRSVMTCGLATALEPPYFNHAPVWGATCPLRLWNMARTCFNPRTRVGCDCCAKLWGLTVYLFQSTHPRGVRQPLTIRASTSGQSFNPRTRVGCDPWGKASMRPWPMFQSTHPRGVRLLVALDFDQPGEFQSTHPRGVRPADVLASIDAAAFQSTHPRGVRPLRHPARLLISYVSIHAPAWGATASSGYFWTYSVRFQSTHPRGVRLNHTQRTSVRPTSFNPRTRVGCDHERTRINSTHGSFNPRTRVGCDAAAVLVVPGIQRFNPRTRVGCDCFHVLSSRFP